MNSASDPHYAALISVRVGSGWAAMCAAGVIVTLLRRRSGRRWITVAAGLAALVMVFAVERSIGIDARPADTASTVYVEVRNHSGDTLSIVSTDGSDVSIKKLRSGGRTFVRGLLLDSRRARVLAGFAVGAAAIAAGWLADRRRARSASLRRFASGWEASAYAARHRRGRWTRAGEPFADLGVDRSGSAR